MSLLFETILLENRQLKNIHYHNLRFNTTRKNLLGINTEVNLDTVINIPPTIPSLLSYRCRVSYSNEIKKVEFIVYNKKAVNNLEIVICNDINYQYKFEDREPINKLTQDTKADDILIVKNGLVTDTSIANIIFLKNNKWFTPTKPLLKGTQREKLLHENKIIEAEITLEHLNDFESFKLINALRPFNEEKGIPVKYIYI